MLDILIYTQYPKAYGPRRLKEEALKIGLNCKVKSYKNVDLNNLDSAKSIILREPTASKNIYPLRDKILHHYIKNRSKILNKDSYLKWSILDKITQTEIFKSSNISHLESLDLNDLNFPFIAKYKLGSHGDSVYKIENSNDLSKVLKKHSKKDLIFQEFQKSGFDLRAIVIDSKVVGIMKRTPKKGSFLSNFSQGGKVERYKVNRFKDIKCIENIAVKTAKSFKLDFVGVDLMLGNDNMWKVLEVNRGCQFKGFERATKVNVAKLLLKYILNTKNPS